MATVEILLHQQLSVPPHPPRHRGTPSRPSLTSLHTVIHASAISTNFQPYSLIASSNFGSNVVIAVLHTGIAPGHRSFNEAGINPVTSRWKGFMNSPFLSRQLLDNKLVGAWFFHAGGFVSAVGGQPRWRSISSSPSPVITAPTSVTPPTTTAERTPSGIPPSASSSPPSVNLSRHILLCNERALSDRDVGEVHIPLKELLDGPAAGKGPYTFISYHEATLKIIAASIATGILIWVICPQAAAPRRRPSQMWNHPLLRSTGLYQCSDLHRTTQLMVLPTSVYLIKEVTADGVALTGEAVAKIPKNPSHISDNGTYAMQMILLQNPEQLESVREEICFSVILSCFLCSIMPLSSSREHAKDYGIIKII